MSVGRQRAAKYFVTLAEVSDVYLEVGFVTVSLTATTTSTRTPDDVVSCQPQQLQQQQQQYCRPNNKCEDVTTIRNTVYQGLVHMSWEVLRNTFGLCIVRHSDHACNYVAI